MNLIKEDHPHSSPLIIQGRHSQYPNKVKNLHDDSSLEQISWSQFSKMLKKERLDRNSSSSNFVLTTQCTDDVIVDDSIVTNAPNHVILGATVIRYYASSPDYFIVQRCDKTLNE